LPGVRREGRGRPALSFDGRGGPSSERVESPTGAGNDAFTNQQEEVNMGVTYEGRALLDEKIGRPLVRPRPLAAGPRDAIRVNVRVSNIANTTIVSKRLADEIGVRGHGRRCVLAGVLGKHCGPTGPITVAFNECRAREVNAIISNSLPRDTDLIAGRDLLSGSTIQFDRRGVTIVCGRKKIAKIRRR
jgi:hypothetical protein